MFAHIHIITLSFFIIFIIIFIILIIILAASAFADVLVKGAGYEPINGRYTERGEVNGKPFYNKHDAPTSTFIKAIYWSGFDWAISDTPFVYYAAIDDTKYPYQAGQWYLILGPGPLPVVTLAN